MSSDTSPVNAAPGQVNPFVLLGKNISKDASIAFIVVYAVCFFLVLFRLIRRVRHFSVYLLLALFSLVRVATFIARTLAAEGNPDSSSYKGRLVASGVLIIAGFLFLAEAILSLLFDWYVAASGHEPAMASFVGIFRHFALVGMSAIGVVGAVLEVNAISSGNASSYKTGKSLREASGALFVVVSASVIIIAIVIAARGRTSRQQPMGTVHKVVPSILFVIFGACLMVESVYRILAATRTSGFITKQLAVDVLVVLPELVALLLFVLVDADDLTDVRIFTPRRHYYYDSEQGSPHATPYNAPKEYLSNSRV